MRRWILAALLLPFLLLACTDPQQARTEVCPTPVAEALAATPRPHYVDFAASVLEGARILRDYYVDKGTEIQPLLDAAWTAARDYLLRAGDPRDIPAKPSSDPGPQLRNLIEKAPAGVLYQDVTDAALVAMARSMNDDHTYYLGARAWENERLGISLSYGYRTVKTELGSVVVDVRPGSSADQAGLLPGDIVTLLNDLPVEDFNASRFSFQQGTPFAITYTRRQSLPNRVVLTLQPLPVARIRTSVAHGDIGVIRLDDFPRSACGARQRFNKDIVDAIFDLRDKGVRAWVLDLRSNSGGSISAAADLSARFGVEPKTTIASITYRDGKTDLVKTAASPFVEGDPVVMLVDGRSASASEITANAFKQTGRAHTVGTRTAGSVAATRPFPVGNGAMFVTVGRVLGGTLRPLDKVGVTPEQPVDLDLSLLAREGRDSQLEAAIDYLKHKLE